MHLVRTGVAIATRLPTVALRALPPTFILSRLVLARQKKLAFARLMWSMRMYTVVLTMAMRI
jgi:hypothetical protein